MPGFLDVSIVGDEAGVQAMLLHLETKLSPPSLGVFLAAKVDPFLRVRSGQRFAGEGDDVVGQWLPLTAATQGIRQQMGYGAAHPINRRTGQLEDYIRNAPSNLTVHPAGANLTYPGTPATGDTLDKLQTAQQGSPFPATPPRPVLGVNERDLAAVLTMLALEIQRP